MPVDTFTVAASADDGYVQNTSGSFAINTSGANAYFGTFSTTQTFHSFFRFTSVTLAQAEHVNSAILNLTMGSDSVNSGPTLSVAADAADSSGQVTSWTDLTSRTTTTAVTSWTATSGWSTASLDVTAIVQEVVNRAGWASGQALQLFVKDNGSSNTYSTARTKDNGSGIAQLVVNHGATPTSRRRPPVVLGRAVARAAVI